ncbi:hypothetical protein SAMN04489731_11220 [Amycolatopsis regifaucium]|nr:hypothetical protein SAMN04489731_11220 [Amycolatopsis regifaucium]
MDTSPTSPRSRAGRTAPDGDRLSWLPGPRHRIHQPHLAPPVRGASFNPPGPPHTTPSPNLPGERPGSPHRRHDPAMPSGDAASAAGLVRPRANTSSPPRTVPSAVPGRRRPAGRTGGDRPRDPARPARSLPAAPVRRPPVVVGPGRRTRSRAPHRNRCRGRSYRASPPGTPPPISGRFSPPRRRGPSGRSRADDPDLAPRNRSAAFGSEDLPLNTGCWMVWTGDFNRGALAVAGPRRPALPRSSSHPTAHGDPGRRAPTTPMPPRFPACVPIAAKEGSRGQACFIRPDRHSIGKGCRNCVFCRDSPLWRVSEPRHAGRRTATFQIRGHPPRPLSWEWHRRRHLRYSAPRYPLLMHLSFRSGPIPRGSRSCGVASSATCGAPRSGRTEE